MSSRKLEIAIRIKSNLVRHTVKIIIRKRIEKKELRINA